MKYYEISNTKSINGKVNIENSKNAILPILAATVLINDDLNIKYINNSIRFFCLQAFFATIINLY